MPKQGFNNQWVEIARVGNFRDSKGVRRRIDREFLETVIANYNSGSHEAPLVVGHPETDSAPAFGWAQELRMNGDVLEFKATDTDDDFETLVRDGRYKKRSASFYMEPPNLRHIGFLGAQPPAVKGLRNIQFADGESFAVETFNLQEKKMEEKDLDQLPESFWEKFKSKLGLDKRADLKEGGNPVPQPATASFSESDVRELVADAVKTAKEELTSDFSEKLKEKDDELKTLREAVDAGTASGRRAEIVSFVEAIPAEKGKHFLKNAGIVEFLEACAAADAKDAEPVICLSEGEGDDKRETKLSRVEWAKNLFSALPPFIEFGERFAGISTAQARDAADSGPVKEMLDAMGVKTKAAGGDE